MALEKEDKDEGDSVEHNEADGDFDTSQKPFLDKNSVIEKQDRDLRQGENDNVEYLANPEEL